jgi:uncharacterized membrane protein
MMPGSLIGLTHLVAAILALVCGSTVLIMRKGTRTHQRWGYAYVLAMAVMLVTSFMIYRLFQQFGIFHIFSVAATITLLAGFVPALRRKPAHWIYLHFGFMYWSVVGLYAALAAEVLTRVGRHLSVALVALPSLAVIGIGIYFWTKKRKLWSSQFGSYRIAAGSRQA